MRFLMWLLLGVLVVFALRKKAQNLTRPAEPSQPFQAPPQEAEFATTATENAETMVCCELCQLYIPASEAVIKEHKSYCCAAHADQS
ncbi:PP0621 family protein [Undibacterium sp. Ren11W]|uniref:PP0621 family protein n=1 Tax=Undibacterium sp. Ren11W TaxID=3413045 RepID=UPI003BF425E4